MKDLFSVQEVAKLLDMSHSGVLYHIKNGTLKSTQVGKIYIITKEQFVDGVGSIIRVWAGSHGHDRLALKMCGITFRKHSTSLDDELANCKGTFCMNRNNINSIFQCVDVNLRYVLQ